MSLPLAVFWGCYLLLGYPLLHLRFDVRHDGFERLAQRSDVVIEAIRRHVADHGAPPADLKALAPAYLPSPPITGMPAYRNWELMTGDEAARWIGWARKGPVTARDAWVIYLDCPAAVLQFDSFFYFPGEDYPDVGYGGRIERIGRWAYVHE